MKRYFRFIYLSLALTTLLTCCTKTEKVFKNGVNYDYNNNNSIESEYYIKDGKYSGLFVRYSDSTIISSMGTFLNGRRNGLWDTLISEDQRIQLFYSNDSVLRAYKNVYAFRYLKFVYFDFTIYNPLTWEIKDSLNINFWLTSNATTFKGTYPPQFLLYKIEDAAGSVEELVQKASIICKAPDSGVYDFQKFSDGKYSFSKNYKQKIMYKEKIIKTKTGFYCLSCNCTEEYYYFYNDVFETILNSFNPISEMPN